MNPQMLGRLIWKEFRTVRGLWLGLLAITSFLQGALLCFLPSRYGDIEPLFMTASRLVPALFVLGASVLIYVHEREEGADILSFRLPVSATGAWMAKLLVTWIGTVLLISIALSVEELGWQWIGTRGGSRSVAGFVGANFNDLVLIVVALLTWGPFFSVMCRRTINCLIAMSLAAYFEVVSLQAPANTAMTTAATISMFGLLLASIVWQWWWVQRWAQDRWPATLERIWNASRPAGLETTTSALSSPIQIARDEHLASSCRQNGRILWLEWRRARWMLFMGLMSVVYLIATSGSTTFVTSDRAWLPPTLCVVFALLCGVCSVTFEQVGARYLILSQWGVSPRRLLCLKSVVWLGIAAVLAASVLVTSAFTHPLYIHQSNYLALGGGDMEALSLKFMGSTDVALRLRLHQVTGGSFDYTSLLPRAWFYLMVMFGISQWAGIVFRRTIVATGVAVGLMIATTLYCVMVSVCLIPLSVAFGILTLGVIWNLDRAARCWLEQRASVRTALQFSLIGVATVAVSLAGVFAFRAWEIPLIEQPEAMMMIEAPDEAAKARGQELLRLGELVQLNPRLDSDRELTHAISDSEWFNPTEPSFKVRRQVLDDNRDVLEQARRLLSNPAPICVHYPSLRRDSVWGIHQLRLSQFSKLFEWSAVVTEDDPEAALNHALMMCQLSQVVRSYGAVPQELAADQLWERAQRTWCWCAARSSTSEMRARVWQQLRPVTGMKREWSNEAGTSNRAEISTGHGLRYGLWKGVATDDWELHQAWQIEFSEDALHQFPLNLPWERERRERLRRVVWKILRERDFGSQDVLAALGTRHWELTTIGLHSSIYWDSMSVDYHRRLRAVGWNWRQATRLQDAILSYREKHGRLPTSLPEVLDRDHPDLLKFYDARCEYYPEGLAQDWKGKPTLIPKGKPCLVIQPDAPFGLDHAVLSRDAQLIEQRQKNAHDSRELWGHFVFAIPL